MSSTNGSLTSGLDKALRGVTKDWKKAKDGKDRISRSRLHRVRMPAPPRYSIRDAAFDVMEQAYNHASANGQYYANARQIMYAARPLVLEATGGECWKNSSYFTQTLLKDYLEEFEPGWKVVWDARGHLHEPHTGRSVDLGGVAIEKYLGSWKDDFDVSPAATIPARIDTRGPALRYGAALFIEKEGFAPILDDAGIAQKYDIATLSTKGLSNKAACDLINVLERDGVRILVARDFDLAGFKIVRTLQNGTRLAAGTPVIDIGLRLEDVENLESEPVDYEQGRDPRRYLRQCGATEMECDFLVEDGYPGAWSGQRVELNAMTSEQLIEWLEGKLEEHGVEKLVPESDLLFKAYRRAHFRNRLLARASDLAKESLDVEVPDNLEQRVRDHLEDEEYDSWDEAIAAIVDDESEVTK